MKLGLGISISRPSGAGLAFPSAMSGLGLRLSAQYSTIKPAIDGNGIETTDGGLVGHVSDVTGAFPFSAPSDNERWEWHADALGLGVPMFRMASAAKFLANATAGSLLSGNPPTFTAVYVGMAQREIDANQLLWCCNRLNAAGLGNASGRPCIYSQIQGALATADRPRYFIGRANDTAAAQTQVNSVTDQGVIAGGQPWMMHATVWDEALQRNWQNGILLTSQAGSPGNYTHFATEGVLTINGAWSGAGTTNLVPVNHRNGWLYEFLVYDRALSEAELDVLYGYYAAVFRVPFSATPGVIQPTWGVGDSHLEGDPTPGTIASFFRRAQRWLPYERGALMSCRGVSGLHAQSASDLLDHYDAFKAHVAAGDLVVLGPIGSNDAIQDGTPANFAAVQELLGWDDPAAETGTPEVMPNFRAVIADAIGRGAIVIVPSDPQRKLSSAGATADRLAGIGHLRDQKRLHTNRYDRAVFVDVYEATRNGAELSDTYNDDGIHLNVAGHVVIDGMNRPAYEHLRFNPTSLASLVGWFSGRNQTATLADGASMASIADLSGTSDATQATVGNQPTFRIGTLASNYMPTLRFDGVDDFAGFDQLSLLTWTVFFAASKTGNALRPILGADIGATRIRTNMNALTEVRFGDLTEWQWSHPAMSAFDVVAVRSTGEMWINGVAAALEFAPNPGQPLVLDQLGAISSGILVWDGDIGDAMIFDEELSNGLLTQVGNYLAFKYGKPTWAVSA